VSGGGAAGKCAYHFEEVVGVVRRGDACAEDAVVAGVFALGEHFARGEPREGIHPVEGAGGAGEELGRKVSAFDVGEFVREDGTAKFFGPCVGALGKEDDWTEGTPGHGNGDGVALA
jgi:hypothetical protein